MKKDLTKIFIEEIYSKYPKKTFETNKIIYNSIDEIWSFGLADMNDNKNSNNRGYRYIFIIIDKFGKDTWVIPPDNKTHRQKLKIFQIFYHYQNDFLFN